MKKYLKRTIKNVARGLGLVTQEDLQQQWAEALDPAMWRMMLNQITCSSQGVQLLLSDVYHELMRQKAPLPDLPDTEFRCFSQNGEDGILLYLFSLVGTTNKKAVEICAGSGIECNTANLIINHGWFGLLLDGDEQDIALGKRFYSRCRDTLVSPPTLVAAWITVDNINALVSENGFAGDIDLLSLDMDGVDYWIWRALACIRPRVVVLEFNAAWGPLRAVTVPYKPAFRLDFSKQPFCCGASLAAFVKLGQERGYRLVGTHRLGFNALFLRSDIGGDLFPEISPVKCFERHRVLRNWSPTWVPSIAERPEWGDVVEV
jgi:hypothetical protein